MVEKSKQCIAKKEPVQLSYQFFVKTFDCLTHKILLAKLNANSFEELSLECMKNT